MNSRKRLSICFFSIFACFTAASSMCIASDLEVQSETVSLVAAVTSDQDIVFPAGSTISGSYTTTGSITAEGSLILDGDTTLTALKEITIGAQISSAAGNSYNLTLDASTNPISIGGDVVNLHSFTIANASQISLFDVITLGGPINIACPVMVQAGGGTIALNGGDISFGGFVTPINANGGSSLDILTARTINLGDTGPFGSVILTGTVHLSGTITSNSLVINGQKCCSASCPAGTYTSCPSCPPKDQGNPSP